MTRLVIVNSKSTILGLTAQLLNILHSLIHYIFLDVYFLCKQTLKL